MLQNNFKIEYAESNSTALSVQDNAFTFKKHPTIQYTIIWAFKFITNLLKI